MSSTHFSDVVMAMVQDDMRDLSMRQCAVLIAAVEAGPMNRADVVTVRALAARLDVAKPAITRAMDRLTELGLGERRRDPRDKRSIYFVPSKAGVRLAVETMGARV